MTRSEIERALIDYIVNNRLEGEASELELDTPLFGLGILDSLSIHGLLSFVETAFQVRIDDGDILPQSLESVRAIADLVERSQPIARTGS